MANLSMTRAEREAFLADLHVGVLSVNGDGATPVTAPIWYSYEPGGTVNVIIAESSVKAAALARSQAFALCAQREELPYAYVTVEGPVVATEPVDAAERRAMAHRYFGAELGDAYYASTGGDDTGGGLTVRMRPERWRTVDYGKSERPTAASG
jgi:nitroimidazol reductase NimA-like FMN-containing flavoprotein (pyridoxamine 5'-phosphate oxidase superfamily)